MEVDILKRYEQSFIVKRTKLNPVSRGVATFLLLFYPQAEITINPASAQNTGTTSQSCEGSGNCVWEKGAPNIVCENGDFCYFNEAPNKYFGGCNADNTNCGEIFSNQKQKQALLRDGTIRSDIMSPGFTEELIVIHNPER